MSSSAGNQSGAAALLKTMRLLLLAVFLIGAVGVAAELLLLGHTEDRWQWAPLLLIAASLIVLIVHAIVRRAMTVRIFQVVMLLYVISGLVGSYLHYEAKAEFRLEMDPSLTGWQLFRESILGGSVPPVLAPGTMIQLGLLGLVFAYRHPLLSAVKTDVKAVTAAPSRTAATGEDI